MLILRIRIFWREAKLTKRLLPKLKMTTQGQRRERVRFHLSRPKGQAHLKTASSKLRAQGEVEEAVAVAVAGAVAAAGGLQACLADQDRATTALATAQAQEEPLVVPDFLLSCLLASAASATRNGALEPTPSAGSQT